MLALFRFLRLTLLGFRSRLPLLPDQGCQGLTDWKLVSDGLDNVLQFIFATSKGVFFVPRRNGEIERRIPDRVPWEALFQTPIFVGRQNKKEVANPVSHSHHRVNRKPGEKQAAALCLSANTRRRYPAGGARCQRFEEIGLGQQPTGGRHFYCRARCLRSSASWSLISSPLTSTVTL
jgi:hypothetical protein